MRSIRIIRGAYGHRPEGSTLTTTKTSADPPFEVADTEAERLVKMGVAEYAETPVAPSLEKPEYEVGANGNKLKVLMKAAGLTPKVGMTKEEMVAALDEFYTVEPEDDASDPDEEDGGDEVLPDLGAEEPVI